ncbi:MFS transporter [Sphingomonas azotifigens]|uniref:MFS transporter n=1 Tax=Sphingomonas azotifigens TaxID=330920 RepID=UPI001C3F611E|nr:MFS transporter [Sphingomonas azotifigens]
MAAAQRNGFRWAMITLILIEALSSFEHVMIIAALPFISRAFGLASAGWVVTSFLLVQASSAAIGARLGDMYGRERVLAVILVLTTTGSLISAFGGSIHFVIVGRCLQGLSGANLALCYGIARQMVPAKRLPFWVGALTGGVTLAAAFGYILGGYLADLGSWRLIFWFAAGYGAIVLPLLLVTVPRLGNAPPIGGVDWLGGVLLPLGVAGILYAVTSSVTQGGRGPWVAGAGVAGVVLLLWWWGHEWRRPDPLIQVRLLTQRPVLIANLCFAIAALGIMQFPLVLIQYLQQPAGSGAGLGLSATAAGWIKLPSNVGSLLAAMLAGWLCGRHGGRPVIQYGGLLAALSLGSFPFFHGNPWQIMAITIGGAAGMTTLLAAVPNVVLAHVQPERAGEATGLTMTVLRVFTAAGAQLVTLSLAASATPALAGGRAYPTEFGYTVILAGVALSGILIVLVAQLGKGAARPRHT